jgi:hypothetical protein
MFLVKFITRSRHRVGYRPIRIKTPAAIARMPSKIEGIATANAVIIPQRIRRIANNNMPMFLVKFMISLSLGADLSRRNGFVTSIFNV